jgi:S-DNA-T family DNA segregation ATPase FtsK/SpoIIIE
MLGVALFVGISLVSGLFTGAADFVVVESGAGATTDLNASGAPVYHNWLGGIGAHTSHVLGRKAFGLGALSLPVWLGLWAWPWITGRRRSGELFALSLVWLLAVPWTAGCFAVWSGNVGVPAWDMWTGATGHFLASESIRLLGHAGSGLVMGTIAAVLVAYYGFSTLSSLRLPAWSRSAEDVDPDDIEDEGVDDDGSGPVNRKGPSARTSPGDAPSGGSARSRSTKPSGPVVVADDDTDDDDGPPWAVNRVKNEMEVEDENEIEDEVEVEDGRWFGRGSAGRGGAGRGAEPTRSAAPVRAEVDADGILDDLLEELGVPEEDVVEAERTAAAAATVGAARVGGVSFEVRLADEEEVLSEAEIDQRIQEFGEYDPTLELSRFEFPSIDLLVNHGDGKHRVSKSELEANKNRILETLRHFGIEVSSIKAEVGPTVTLYEIVPAPGIRISKIKNLEDDIALSLAALGIRIIAPIPGRGTVGIEVPNSTADVVSMRSLIASDKFQTSDAALPVAIGKTISNETYVFDLAKMPHLLMAGATGQGKSVGLNAILVSLLYRKHPSQLKFVLVDPKKVELTLFNHIERHYLAKLPGEEDAIITDTSKVVATLNSLCIEMDKRYDLLKDAGCRNLKEYNAKFVQRRLNPNNGHRYLPYIVLVVDEFADLIMTAGKEVETPIARLAQLARAIGIHLIIATQRPSVNIITGTIKANFPARIAFRVTSKIDSRTILDAGGADQLIGRGDLLLSTGNDLTRLQCGFVDTPEVEAICAYIGSQQGYPSALILPEYTPEGELLEGGMLDDDERDEFFDDAARLIVLHQQGSTSLIQRKLKLGYNRAGRIIDQLERAGVLGPFEGTKARKVLIPDEASLEHILQREGL